MPYSLPFRVTDFQRGLPVLLRVDRLARHTRLQRLHGPLLRVRADEVAVHVDEVRWVGARKGGQELLGVELTLAVADGHVAVGRLEGVDASLCTSSSPPKPMMRRVPAGLPV